MTDEARPGNWHVVWDCDEHVKVLDGTNSLIATVAGGDNRALARASLIAASPELFDAVDAAVQVFQVMAKYGDELAAAAAADMIPPLESALEGASFLGEITPDVLKSGF